MNKEELLQILKDGEEIEFKYNDKMFSITFFNDNGKAKISFCEFYKEPIDVDNVDELLKIKWDNVSVEKMLSKLKEDNIMIF